MQVLFTNSEGFVLDSERSPGGTVNSSEAHPEIPTVSKNITYLYR